MGSGRAPSARAARLARPLEGCAAGLAFALADWLASGPARQDPGLATLILASALAGGLFAGLSAVLLCGGRGSALGLALGGALVLDGLVHASTELSGSLARLVFLACTLVASVLAARLGARAWARAAGPALAFALCASVPAVDLVRHELRDLPQAHLAACALPVALALLASTLARRGVRVLAALAAVALATTGWRGDERARAPASERSPPGTLAGAPDVCLIVVDTLRADHADVRGDPERSAFARLARDGVRFEQAIASAPWTLPSVASLLTSLHPTQHGALEVDRALPASVTTLAERFAAAGYDTAAYTGGGFVAPAFGLDQGFRTFDGDAEYRFRPSPRHAPLAWHVVRNRWLPQRWILARVDAFGGLGELRDRIGRWLELRSAERPFFLFVHSYEVHDYYLYDAAVDGPLRDARPSPAGKRLSVHPEELFRLSQAELDWFGAVYRARVAHVDRELALLFDRLERAATRPAIVALCADHGEGFDAALGRVHHGGRLHDDLLRVPLLVRAPGLAPGRVVSEQVSLLDLGPTLLELAGLPRATEVAGRSLVPALAGSEPWPSPAWSEERGGERALRTASWKVVGSGTERFGFDLQADPLETRPQAPAAERPPAALLEEWDGFPARWPPRAASEHELDEDTRAELRALGYVE